MPNPPNISAAEWDVMEVLWCQNPLTAGSVVEALQEKQWAANTVRTLLTRLVKKGALHYEQDGNRYLYRPAVRREDCVQGEVDSLAARLFGGAVSPLLLQFVKSQKLSASEIAELKRILNGKEGK